MKLSVIVPVYNVAAFLEKCIMSIAEQDIPHTEYEIVAINDGATDESPQILRDLQSRVSNLVIVNQENQGLSGARNSGFDVARGDYMICVDSDDYLLPNVLNTLYTRAVENSLDILEFAAYGVDENGETTYEVAKTTGDTVLSGEKYLNSIYYMSSACNKVYRRQFIKQHSLQFMERVYIEDIEFNTRAVFLAERVMATDFVAAHFLQREGSITRTKNFEKKEKMIRDIYKVIHAINTFTEKKVTSSSEAYIPLKKRVSSLVATLLIRVLKETRSVHLRKEILDKLKKDGIYPVRYPAETQQKRLFLLFANQNWLFGTAQSYLSSRNRKKYGA